MIKSGKITAWISLLCWSKGSWDGLWPLREAQALKPDTHIYQTALSFTDSFIQMLVFGRSIRSQGWWWGEVAPGGNLTNFSPKSQTSLFKHCAPFSESGHPILWIQHLVIGKWTVVVAFPRASYGLACNLIGQMSQTIQCISVMGTSWSNHTFFQGFQTWDRQ